MDPTEERDWANLPWDVLFLVFDNLGAVEIFRSAQAVCRSWWNLSSSEPRFWKHLHLCPAQFLDKATSDDSDDRWLTKDDLVRLTLRIRKRAMKLIAFAAKRCDGNLEEISMEEIGDDKILNFITRKVRGLKQLRLFTCLNLSEEGVIKSLSNLTSSLEELEIVNIEVEESAFTGQSLPNLKCLRLIDYHVPYSRDLDPNCNGVAFAIAKNMTGLRELWLFCNALDDAGLDALLNGCPNLESISLHNCINLCMNEELQRKCARLNVRLLDGRIDDYAHFVDGLFTITDIGARCFSDSDYDFSD